MLKKNKPREDEDEFMKVNLLILIFNQKKQMKSLSEILGTNEEDDKVSYDIPNTEEKDKLK